MASVPFDEETLRAVCHGDCPEGYELLHTEISDTTRWSIRKTMRFSFEGKLYESDYSVGATEHQDQEAYDYDEPVAYEVRAVQKTITVYERV